MIKINLYYFFISLCFGFFLVYITTPKPKVIVKYPNLKNYNKLTYVDDNGVCYKYKPIEVKSKTYNVVLPEEFVFINELIDKS